MPSRDSSNGNHSCRFKIESSPSSSPTTTHTIYSNACLYRDFWNRIIEMFQDVKVTSINSQLFFLLFSVDQLKGVGYTIDISLRLYRC